MKATLLVLAVLMGSSSVFAENLKFEFDLAKKRACWADPVCKELDQLDRKLEVALDQRDKLVRTRNLVAYSEAAACSTEGLYSDYVVSDAQRKRLEAYNRKAFQACLVRRAVSDIDNPNSYHNRLEKADLALQAKDAEVATLIARQQKLSSERH